MSHHVSWFAGIDLGDRKHHVHLTDASGTFCGAATFSHGGRGIARLLSWLVEQTGADPGSIGVALEVPHGAVVDGLLDRGFLVFAINPKQADRARELFVLSGAKDDPRDADGLSVVLRTVPQVFRHLQPKHPVLVRLRDRSRLRADLVKRRTQLTQKIRAQLLRYFPAMWELAGELSGLWGALFLTLWERAPTPERARRLRRATLQRVLRECRIRKRTVEDVVCPVPPADPGGRAGCDRGGGGDHPVAGGPVAAGERPGEDDGPGNRGLARRVAGGPRRSRRRSRRGGLADPAALDEGCGNGGRRGTVRGGERSPGGGQLPADPAPTSAPRRSPKSPGRPRGSTSGGP